MVFTGGLVGWNAQQEWEHDDMLGQFRQTLENIVAVLASAGASPQHLVRLTWYITDKKEYREVVSRNDGVNALIVAFFTVQQQMTVNLFFLAK